MGSRPHHRFTESYVGVYQPLPYVLPGLATKLTNDRDTAFRLARFAALLSCLLLVAAGVWAYADTPARLAAAALALTPSSSS